MKKKITVVGICLIVVLAGIFVLRWFFPKMSTMFLMRCTGKFELPAVELTAEEIAAELAAEEKLQRQRERKRANTRRFIEKRQREMAQEQEEEQKRKVRITA